MKDLGTLADLLWALTAEIDKFINNHSKSRIYDQPSFVQQKDTS